MRNFTAFLLAVLLDVPTILFEAFVLVKLWAWFVLPLGAPIIGMAQAAGLALLAKYASSSASDAKEKIDSKDPIVVVMTRIINANVRTAVAWGLGAAFAGFM